MGFINRPVVGHLAVIRHNRTLHWSRCSAGNLQALDQVESELSQRIVVPKCCAAQSFPRLVEQQPRSHRILSLCGTFIPMVQATESRVSNNPTPSSGSNSASGRLLSQSQMRAILVIVAKGRSLHPAGDASLGYVEAEHERFAVDAGSTPGWVLCHHPEDQIPHFARDP